MRHEEVDLGGFDGSDFSKGASMPKIVAWYFVNALLVRPAWLPFMSVKLFLLRLFGATIGKGCVVKNNVVVKSPWNLVVGDNCWIGEDVWIDNLDKVVIEDDVCLSQGAMLLTGNHDYSVRTMPYRNAPIRLCRGAWIGAKAVVCSGVVAGRNSILTVGSVATKDMDPCGIYQGNPAVKVRMRKFRQ